MLRGEGEEVNQRRAEAARTISDVASGTDSPEKEPGSNSNAADRWLLFDTHADFLSQCVCV